ncbi:MAG: hypothetical protein ACTSU3_04415 [Candidatus Thorarchaeota archaeon]
MAIDDGPGPQGVKLRSSYALGVDGLVGRTISLWSRKLPQYALIVGITGVALVIIQSIALISLFGLVGLELLEFIGTSPIDSIFSIVLYEIPANVLLVIFILSLFGLVVYAVVAGAAINYSLTDYENPGTADIGESFSIALGRASSLIGVQVLQSLIVLGLAVVAVLTIYIDFIISFVVIIVVLYIAVRLAPAPAIVIAEDQSSIGALLRSWQITGGLFWHVFLGQLLMGIVLIIIDLAIAVGVGIGFLVIIPNLELLLLVSAIITSLLLSPINYIFQAVLYKDLEARGTASGSDWWQ